MDSGITCTVKSTVTTTGPFKLADRQWWWTASYVTGVYFSASAVCRDRTDSTVTVSVTWTQTVTAASFFGYDMYYSFDFTTPSGVKTSTGNVLIANHNVFGKNSDKTVDRTVSFTTDFVVSGLGPNDSWIEFRCVPYTVSSDPGDTPAPFTGKLTIPVN